jgi:hypothetical protein
VEWLLKTRFGDGFHMSFSVMRIYTDNKTGTIDDVVTPAQNVPWENFLASAVFCRASKVLEKSHPELARQAKIAATEDWNAAMALHEKWDQADYREAAWGVTSSLLLGEMTGDIKYTENAVHFGDLLIGCQEQRLVDGIPIAGYFYTDTDRKTVIHNYHASFEEAPLIALAMLCRELPGHERWIDWYSAAAIHSEYFMKRGSHIASPYDLLPNSVWRKQEIMSEKDPNVRADMLRQFNDGTPLSADVMLRTFPIYHDDLFHGNTNIHMSGTWALAEASRLRNDTSGMQLAGKQIEWVLGANPFGKSLMYGVGYDFAPHFAYCLKDIVGSLPVGMDCMSGDMPYWSATNTATHNEIWVEPVSRFLGAVSIYATYAQPAGEKQAETRIKAETTREDNEKVTILITLTGKGKHSIDLKVFNAQADFKGQEFTLSENKSEKLEVFLQVMDRSKPYVAVISVDNNPDNRREITGSLQKSNI